MSNIKPETLEALRVALEAKRLRCPQWHISEAGICMTCARYQVDRPSEVTGPDPAYAPLLALVREEAARADENGSLYHHSRTAYWRAAPEGTLAGALFRVLWQGWAASGAGIHNQTNVIVAAIKETDNPDQTAAEVVLAWVKGEDS